VLLHRASTQAISRSAKIVHVAGPLRGRTVLVQGAAGAVGLCAVQLARRAGAHVIGTIRSSSEEATATKTGAHEVVRNDDLSAALKAGWSGFEIAERIPLSEIARAHELVEHPVRRGRVVVVL